VPTSERLPSSRRIEGTAATPTVSVQPSLSCGRGASDTVLGNIDSYPGGWIRRFLDQPSHERRDVGARYASAGVLGGQ
jgi:hypothetical protein